VRYAGPAILTIFRLASILSGWKVCGISVEILCAFAAFKGGAFERYAFEAIFYESAGEQVLL
jgi:hypothetical protein